MTTAALLLLLQTAEAVHRTGTGREWMVIAAILIPFVVLIAIISMGARKTVGSSLKSHD